MAMEVDGVAILSALARAPEKFGFNESALNILAVGALTSKLKEKTTDIGLMRSVAGAIGFQDFALVLDHMGEKEIAALTKRLDPKNTEMKNAGRAEQRERLVVLAERRAEPAVAPSKPTKPPKTPPVSKPPKTGAVMKSKALKARSSKRAS